MTEEQGEPIVAEITCQEIAQWASAYLDEHVENERKRQIALHLAICAGCETYVTQIATVRDVVGSLPQADEASSNLARVRQAVIAQVRRSLPRS